MALNRKPLLDPDHPMFAKVWVRWVTVALPILWGVGEFIWASPYWGMLFVAAGVYAGKVLLLNK